MLLRKIAAHFDCAVTSVWVALKQINFTLKKMISLRNKIQRKSLKRLVDNVFSGLQLSQDK